MQILILAVGKIKEDYLKKGIEDYKKRLSKYTSISVVEVPEEDISKKQKQEVLEKEAQKLNKFLPDSNSFYIIALDRLGEELSSEQFSNLVESNIIHGKSDFAFIIGGALGLDKSILSKSDFVLSLSKLTFTHQIARFILLEQIYRAIKIIKKEPYHY